MFAWWRKIKDDALSTFCPTCSGTGLVRIKKTVRRGWNRKPSRRWRNVKCRGTFHRLSADEKEALLVTSWAIQGLLDRRPEIRY